MAGKPKAEVIDFVLPPTVHLYCGVCKGRWPANPMVDHGAAETDTSGSDQTSMLAYQCQSCKSAPVRFLVTRENRKLQLSGRAPIEDVIVPDVLPKPFRGYFSNAVIAFQCGQTLAAVFLLRVLIEQFWRSQKAIGEKLKSEPRLSGEQLGQLYAESLPKAFKEQFPSLSDLYGKLSESMHLATANADFYQDCRDKVIEHFDARRLFKL